METLRNMLCGFKRECTCSNSHDSGIMLRIRTATSLLKHVCKYDVRSLSQSTAFTPNPSRNIKRIISKHRRYEQSAESQQQIVDRIFAIYNATDHNIHSDHMINDVLRGCILFHQTNRVFASSFWSKIERQIQRPQNRIDPILLLKCCMRSNEYHRGMEVISILGLSTSSDGYIQCTLIDFHGHFGDILTAKLIFDSVSLEKEDAVFVGAMMKALINNDHIEQALTVYDDAVSRRLTNSVCDLLAIKAAMKSGDTERGREIHQSVMAQNRLNASNEERLSLKATLIDFYGTSGDIESALNVFQSIDDKKKDIWVIGAMMEALYSNQRHHECLQLFDGIESMNSALRPDVACYSIIIKNCTATTAWFVGQRIYDEMKRNPHRKWMLREIEIQIKWIHFYGKCGEIGKCEEIWSDIERIHYQRIQSDIAPYSAMMAAYGRNGEMSKVRVLYKKVMEGVMAQNVDRKFIILVMNACSHCDDMEMAKRVWSDDIKAERIRFDSFVITAAVDCFARKGRVEEARGIIDEYEQYQRRRGKVSDREMQNERSMWLALLSGSKVFGDLEMTQRIYNEIKRRFQGIQTEERSMQLDSVPTTGPMVADFEVDKLDQLLL